MLNLRLRIIEPDETQRTVEFEFDMNSDTATSVASEMVGVLELSPEDADAIALAMHSEIETLLSGLEGQASSRVAQAAAELQQELLLQANTGDDEGINHEPSSSSRQNGLMPSFESMASFHSMDSMQSHGVHSIGAMSARSSPTKEKPISIKEEEQIGDMQQAAVGDMFQKLHMLPNGTETPESIRRRSTDTVTSPATGMVSPVNGINDLDKRSLNKLYENLLEVGEGERKTTLTPPPPKPPLHPLGSKSSFCSSSPASLDGDSFEFNKAGEGNLGQSEKIQGMGVNWEH